ncbi:hypothetical protein COV14_05150 [Candidatus Woesearchaeota archaeon CG10_big_fil_rev_8_21_14_0_10_33_12]|nr:MAG: hypothetical protein COV14_05150 [Candidatus Woesearchaeota archaeon CG10_big_fil_rev_8_21_14_0_10_33_12]
MKTEEHEESLKQHKEAIFDWAIEVKGIENSQRIIGLHASRAALDILAIYLQKTKRIGPGMQLNHRWFKSKKVSGKLPAFPHKAPILEKIIELEKTCEKLSYGSKKDKSEVLKAVKLLQNIEEDVTKVMKNELE